MLQIRRYQCIIKKVRNKYKVDYKVSFFKKADPEKQDGKDEFLGNVTVSDFGLEGNESILSRAFRQAVPNAQTADKTVTVRV